MDKRGQVPVHTFSRALVDELISIRGKCGQHRLDVRHDEADVVHPFAAFLKKTPDRAIIRKRLEDFDPRIRAVEEGDFEVLGGSDLRRLGAETKNADIEPERVGRIANRDGDMVDWQRVEQRASDGWVSMNYSSGRG